MAAPQCIKATELPKFRNREKKSKKMVREKQESGMMDIKTAFKAS